MEEADKSTHLRGVGLLLALGGEILVGRNALLGEFVPTLLSDADVGEILPVAIDQLAANLAAAH